jgi:carboxyl-terminal processing protease
MKRKEFFFTFLISLVSLLLAFTAGYFVHGMLFPPELELPILSEARKALLEYSYVDPPPDPVLEYGMIRGMVNEFNDPYTIFLEPPQHELETDRLEGHFGGIGVTFGRDSEEYIVLYPFVDGPALKAGIQDGDRLVGVDDAVISKNTNIDAVEALLRGPANHKVEISIQRPPEYTTLKFSIRREDIPIPSVTWHLVDQDHRLGVFEINIIAASTPDEILHAVDDLQKRGASHFVMDLRGNGGGYLNAGIDIAKLFLSEGTIIEQQYKGKNIETFKVNNRGDLANIPLTILVDQNTASAAEIVAGTLQNLGRAILIGYPTFGKDSIQLVIDLEDGSSIHVTAAKWWIPGSEFPQTDGGLIPELLLPSDEEGSNNAILTAIQYFFSTTDNELESNQ